HLERGYPDRHQNHRIVALRSPEIGNGSLDRSNPIPWTRCAGRLRLAGRHQDRHRRAMEDRNISPQGSRPRWQEPPLQVERAPQRLGSQALDRRPGRTRLVSSKMTAGTWRTYMTKHDHFRQAYLLMAKQARYRPQAPGDGFGNVSLSKEEAADPERLEQEATAYARGFDAEEDKLSFWIGCSDFNTNRAFVWTIEAARVLAGGIDGNPIAITLLQMALADVRRALSETAR